MKIIKDLINELETVLDKYEYDKFGGLELDDDTEMAIYKECRSFFESIKEQAEELDETIDTIIEEANEPSNYDFDWAEDTRRHLENLGIRR